MESSKKIGNDEFSVFEVVIEQTNDKATIIGNGENKCKTNVVTKAKIVKGNGENDEMPKPKTKAKSKSTAKEESDDDEMPKPKTKAKAKAKSKSTIKEKSDESDDSDGSTVKEPKTKPNKTKIIKKENDNEEQEQELKPKTKPGKTKVVNEENDNKEPKSKNDDKIQKECIVDLKKIYTTMKHINLICVNTFASDERLAIYKKLEFVKISKEDRITFINKIGSVLYKLLTINSENSIEKKNIDFMGKFDDNIYEMVNLCLNYIGRYCYDTKTDLINIIDTYINDNIHNRNANIYSIHAEKLYVSENEYIFKGILVVFNEIIEQNYLNSKNKNITTLMFMSVIKEKIIKQIKNLNTKTYNDDKLLKYYVNFKDILMEPDMFEKIIIKLN